ncbi:MAG: aspartate aminotransferase family protein [Ruminococcaceae bacterium]|nr:aspartate aminotransferase family protein [Oscillospiraceae bacterium]
MLEKIIQLDKSFYMNTFGDRTPLVFEKGSGIELTDSKGDVYKDFFAGIAVNALGHSHPKLVSALRNQIENLIHTSSVYYIKNQALLAEKLCMKTCFDKVFFANTGAEANEGAIKLARKYFYNQGKDKYEIITLNKSFHGRTITTATATGQEKYKTPYAPLTPGFIHVDANDIEGLKKSLSKNTCAIMVELIQGESGVRPLDESFVKEIRKICDDEDIIFIVDEVQTGIGRCGKLFAYELYGVEPDIITCAKALGGGVPIGAVLAKDFVADSFKPGDHGTTFGGNPLSCRAGLATLEIIDEEKLIENASEMGDYFMNKLSESIGEYASEVRGKGLMIGIELKKNNAKEICKELMNKKYLVGAVGDSVLRIVPPLIITKEDIDGIVNTLKNILKGDN